MNEKEDQNIKKNQTIQDINGGIDEMIDALNAADRAARLSEEE